MKKKLLSALLGVAMVASLVMGCGAKEEPVAEAPAATEEAATEEVVEAEEVTIKFGVIETLNITSDIWDNMISAFETAHPNIKVEKVVVSGEDRTTAWKTMINSGEFPDIMVEASALGSMGIFAEVPEDVQAIFNEDLFVEYGGKRTTFPAGSQYKGQCYYNKEIYAELGLEVPTTFEEFEANCAAIKEAGITPIMAAGSGDVWATGQMFWISQADPMLSAAYPDFVKGLNEGTYKWNNEITQKVLTAYKELVDAGYYYEGALSLSYSQASEMFLNGEAGMIIDGSWMNATIDGLEGGPDKFGVFVVPTIDGTKAAIGNAGEWGVYNESEHKDACWEFVKFVFDEDTEYYKNWLAADGLFSATKEPVTYEMGPTTTQFLKNIEGYTVYPEVMFVKGDYLVVPGIDTFSYKSYQNIFNGADVIEELEAWDAEYQRLLDAQ